MKKLNMIHSCFSPILIGSLVWYILSRFILTSHGFPEGKFIDLCEKNSFLNYFVSVLNNVQFKKISILPPQKGLEFPGGRGVL